MKCMGRVEAHNLILLQFIGHAAANSVDVRW